MILRRMLLAAVAGCSLLPTACLFKKKESPLISALGKEKLPAPQPPLPTSGGGSTDAAKTGSVQPPSFDPKVSAVPAMPGMPGTASQPIPPDADTLQASADDADRKGLLERIRDRRNEKKTPDLPPATEPKRPDGLPIPTRDPQPVPPSVPDSPRVASPAPAPAKSELAAVREVVEAAAKKNADVPSFEAKLVKRETVKGKDLPAEEAIYRFRKEPLSVHIRVTGDVGTGREVMWVKGQNDNKMTIIVGKGDNILFAAGKKMTMDPDDPLVTAKSRYRIYEAGMSRPIGALTKFVEQAEKGKRPADSIKLLGTVDRKEYAGKLTAVEVTLSSADDSFLPKGGKRRYFFDADPKSPSAGLPVLVISLDHADKEVEYYCFTDFKLVGELTDADFDQSKLGKKK